MSEENTVELSSRGKKQLRSIVQGELKPLIDETINAVLERVINNRVNMKMQDLSFRIEDAIKSQVKEMYWHVMRDALKAADFQELFKNEIIDHLHKKWACGTDPFEEEFNKAMVKAIKTIVGRDGR